MSSRAATEGRPGDPFNDETKRALLESALSAAVPLWIEQLKVLPYEEVMRIARECADIVAHKGDVILYRSPKKGETAAAFNALAKGVACLSFSSGGARVFGLKFEAEHPETTPRKASFHQLWTEAASRAPRYDKAPWRDLDDEIEAAERDSDQACLASVRRRAEQLLVEQGGEVPKGGAP
jgi:hypothetical protein